MKFLERLTPDHRKDVTSCGSVFSYGHDEPVVSFLDETRDVYIVIGGTALVTIFSASGKAVSYRDLSEGDIFGEISAIDNVERSASVIALKHLKVVKFTQPEFDSLLAEDHVFCRAILAHVAQELRRTTARIYEFSTMPMRDRLIAELLRLSNPDGQIAPAPTHQQLADRISSHREAVSREMSALKKEGLLQKRDGVLRIRDIDDLKSLIAE